jgi:hypothetical protein
MNPIQIFAGQKAYQHIENRGLKPQDIRVILGASGGPKWFVLSHLDRYLINHWLPNIPHQVELMGSSIGAWRMSAYAGANPIQSIEHLEYEYLNQRYSVKPTSHEVSQSVCDLLDGFISHQDVEHHHQKKLNIISARAKGITQIENKVVQTAAFTAVAAGNMVSRSTLPVWFDRVVFQSQDAQLPISDWDKFRTTRVQLNEQNYRDALLSSGAIPVVIKGVSNPSGAPRGMYRDGGMVDYHFDLPIKPNDGLVLYPHFMPLLKPGWFDKPLPWRKVQADNYSHTVVVCPSREFVESLPYHKIPDRKDFERLDNDTRIKYWQTVVDRNQMIAEAFHDWTNSLNPIEAVEPISNIT